MTNELCFPLGKALAGLFVSDLNSESDFSQQTVLSFFLERALSVNSVSAHSSNLHQ